MKEESDKWEAIKLLAKVGEAINNRDRQNRRLRKLLQQALGVVKMGGPSYDVIAKAMEDALGEEGAGMHHEGENDG
ncbi:MAG: hypothetical protein GY906_17975 [bacterium]|nr:hypothetical protein [bacterium]